MGTTRGGIRKEDVLDAIRGEGVVQFIGSLGFNPVRKGREYKFACPFHSDKDPSFAIVPHKKPEKGGIFKCHPCGWSGSVFDFVQQTQGLEDFRSTINFMAQKLGLSREGRITKSAKPIQQRASISTDPVKILTAEEISAELSSYQERAIDPTPFLNTMGVRPDALDAIGGCIAPVGSSPVLIVPMRDQNGALCSLRFRSLGPKKPKLGEDGKPKLGPDGKPKMRTVRWSLSRKNDSVVTHESRSGLMAPFSQFEDDPSAEQTSVVLEGETDLLAGVSMMLDKFGTGNWPARWWGLPGVGSCHEMLTRPLLGTSATLFFDTDEAGHKAVFDHRPMFKEKLTGEMHVDLDSPPRVKLLAGLRGLGVHTIAAFPPVIGDGKRDLRDLYIEGWDWDRLEDYFMRTGRGHWA